VDFECVRAGMCACGRRCVGEQRRSTQQLCRCTPARWGEELQTLARQNIREEAVKLVPAFQGSHGNTSWGIAWETELEK